MFCFVFIVVVFLFTAALFEGIFHIYAIVVNKFNM